MTSDDHDVVAEIVSKFRPRFFPKSRIIYTSAVTWNSNQGRSQIDALASIGFTTLERIGMPDVVLHEPEKNWLLLADATTSRSVIDAHRHQQLSGMFGSSPSGLILLSAFSNREFFGVFADLISWQTIVWIASEPDHLIHFNGDGLHGPQTQKRRR